MYCITYFQKQGKPVKQGNLTKMTLFHIRYVNLQCLLKMVLILLYLVNTGEQKQNKQERNGKNADFLCTVYL